MTLNNNGVLVLVYPGIIQVERARRKATQVRGSGSVYKRCGCRDGGSGRQLARRCPRLGRRGHGSWYFAAPRGYGRPLRRGGYATRDQARTALRTLRRTKPLTVRDWLEQWLSAHTRLRATTRQN